MDSGPGRLLILWIAAAIAAGCTKQTRPVTDQDAAVRRSIPGVPAPVSPHSHPIYPLRGVICPT